MVLGSQATLLALSIAVLAIGPLLIGFVQRFGQVLLALDGFVLVSVGGIVPEAASWRQLVA